MNLTVERVKEVEQHISRTSPEAVQQLVLHPIWKTIGDSERAVSLK